MIRIQLQNFPLLPMVFLLVLSMVNTLYSQSSFGPRVGLSITKEERENKSSYTTGFLVGGTLESTQESLVGYRSSIVLAQYGTINDLSITSKESIRFNYLQANFAFKTRIGTESLNVFVSGGGAGNIGVGKVKSELTVNSGNTSSTTTSTLTFSESRIPSLDIGFLLGIGGSMYIGKGILQAELQFVQTIFRDTARFKSYQPCVSYLWEF